MHMRFHYNEEKGRLLGEAEIRLLDELMGRAAGLEPESQELLVKFADYMSKTSSEKAG